MTSIDRNGFIVNHLLSVKGPCRVATTANITLSGTQTIDGVTVEADDRVLVKDQTSAIQNGIYSAKTGEWELADDFDQRGHVVQGTRVLVVNGTTNALTEWYVTTTGRPTPGHSAISFAIAPNSGVGTDQLVDGAVTLAKLASPLTVVASGSFPAAAVLDITDISQNFSCLLFAAEGVSCDTATRRPLVRFSTDNGSSFDDTAANYRAVQGVAGATTIETYADASLIQGEDVAASESWTWNIAIFGYQLPVGSVRISRLLRAGISERMHVGLQHHTSGINALRAQWSDTGNFDSGTYTLYGLR